MPIHPGPILLLMPHRAASEPQDRIDPIERRIGTQPVDSVGQIMKPAHLFGLAGRHRTLRRPVRPATGEAGPIRRHRSAVWRRGRLPSSTISFSRALHRASTTKVQAAATVNSSGSNST